MNIFAHRSRVLQISLAAILSSFVVETSFGVFSNSLALITDGLHALLDALVTAVLLLATRMAVKPPDAEHTYGHGKIESLGGMLGGIAILLIAVFFVYEAAARLGQPPPQVLPGALALVGAAYTIAIDLFRTVLLYRSIRIIGGSTLRADFYHALMDMGSTLLVIAGILFVIYGFHYADFAAALVLGGLLLVLSVRLVYRSASELTDAISPEIVRKAGDIARGTPGVSGVGEIMMRRSGDAILGDITVSLRGDVSFERAHEISSGVEENIARNMRNARVTVHFEPDWSGVPPDSMITEIAASIDGVRNVHNTSSYVSDDLLYATLHVMVQKEMSLEGAHRISDRIEERIRAEIKNLGHVTIHLEPHVAVPEKIRTESDGEEVIRRILAGYPEIRKIGRVAVLGFRDIKKIEIDCSFDGDRAIEDIHEITTSIEREIKARIENALVTIHPEPL